MGLHKAGHRDENYPAEPLNRSLTILPKVTCYPQNNTLPFEWLISAITRQTNSCEVKSLESSSSACEDHDLAISPPIPVGYGLFGVTRQASAYCIPGVYDLPACGLDSPKSRQSTWTYQPQLSISPPICS